MTGWSVCRTCQQPVLVVRETDCKAAIGPMRIEAMPISALKPLERAPPPLWEDHPVFGWRVLDKPVRHGYPIHAIHTCTKQAQLQAPDSLF